MLNTVVSFRSVPKILGLFNAFTGGAGCPWIPHFTSVINWTLRLGLGLLQQVKTTREPWLAIIDHSIDIGTKKALVVLRVSVAALAARGSAIQLADCECIGLRIAEQVNGERVADDLTQIFDQAGIPQAIIKDGDYTLQKGVRLWSERQGGTVPVIQDIGHALAVALKKEFANNTRYQRFVTMTHHGAHRLRQTDLAFLIPPKLRSKGRFQSISNLGQWADNILPVFAVPGRAAQGGLLARLRTAFPGLLRLKSFIKRFATTAQVTSHVMALLKNHGLDQHHYEQCQQLAETLPKNSTVRQRLQHWLQQHLAIQQQLGDLPLLVSSDIIESLFGHFKHILERSPQADMNRTTLLIPALCGQINENTVALAFSQVRQADLAKWENDNIPYTVRKKRQAFFRELKIQKSG